MRSLTRDIHKLKVKEWKKIFNVNSNQKRAGVAALVSGKQTLNQKQLKETKKDIIY